jgi:hypothetical protein
MTALMPAVLTGSALRRAVVALWNRGENTVVEVAEAFGRTQGSIGGILHRPRACGMEVLAFDPSTRSERSHGARRTRLGEAAYQEHLKQHAAFMHARRWGAAA